MQTGRSASPVSLAIAGLKPDGLQLVGAGGLRDVFRWGGEIGCLGVQLSATVPGALPRELDRSARRDLAASLRRVGLGCSGVDCLIPPEHFADPNHCGRALEALGQACAFAREVLTLVEHGAGAMGVGGHSDLRAVVSVLLPRELSDAVRDELVGHAERNGVLLAELSWPRVGPQVGPRDGVSATQPVGVSNAPAGVLGGAGASAGASGGASCWRAAIDPAALLMGGFDVMTETAKSVGVVAGPRLSDVSTAGRVAPGTGEGRLNLETYRAGLQIAGYEGPVVLDLRGVSRQADLAPRSVEAWLSQ